VQYEDKSGQLMMLPTDMALLWDKKFKPHVLAYAKDEEAFFKVREGGKVGGREGGRVGGWGGVVLQDWGICVSTKNEPRRLCSSWVAGRGVGVGGVCICVCVCVGGGRPASLGEV
jgi:hypothetical protein